MNTTKLIIRILFGLMMLVFGLNKFLQFLPFPPMPKAAGEFMGALVKSGYILTIVGIIEVVAGVLLLINKYQALILIVLFPVILNAFLFHLFFRYSRYNSSITSCCYEYFFAFHQQRLIPSSIQSLI